MTASDDDLTPEEEAEFAALPEVLRLALFGDARGHASPLDPLTSREISQAAGIPLPRVERTLRIAVLKLRRAHYDQDTF